MCPTNTHMTRNKTNNCDDSACNKNYYLTHSKQKSSSWKLVVVQQLKKFPTLFMKPESSICRLKGPATGPYPEPAESSPPTHTIFLYDHFNIIIPSTSWSPKWSLRFRFPDQNFLCISHLSRGYYTPRPFHYPWNGTHKNQTCYLNNNFCTKWCI
jgi:hypothetical protein